MRGVLDPDGVEISQSDFDRKCEHEKLENGNGYRHDEPSTKVYVLGRYLLLELLQLLGTQSLQQARAW